MKRAIGRFGDEARAAFSKVGVLMASAKRTAQVAASDQFACQQGPVSA